MQCASRLQIKRRSSAAGQCFTCLRRHWRLRALEPGFAGVLAIAAHSTRFRKHEKRSKRNRPPARPPPSACSARQPLPLLPNDWKAVRMGLDGGTISKEPPGSHRRPADRRSVALPSASCVALVHCAHSPPPTHTAVSRNDVLRGQCWDLNKADDSRSTRGGAVRGTLKRRKLDAATTKWVLICCKLGGHAEQLAGPDCASRRLGSCWPCPQCRQLTQYCPFLAAGSPSGPRAR